LETPLPGGRVLMNAAALVRKPLAAKPKAKPKSQGKSQGKSPAAKAPAAKAKR
jgi:hypothetical protein